MFRIICSMCSKELNEPGALLINPPCNPMKLDLCFSCWGKIFDYIVVQL